MHRDISLQGEQLRHKSDIVESFECCDVVVFLVKKDEYPQHLNRRNRIMLYMHLRAVVY